MSDIALVANSHSAVSYFKLTATKCGIHFALFSRL